MNIDNEGNIYARLCDEIVEESNGGDQIEPSETECVEPGRLILEDPEKEFNWNPGPWVHPCSSVFICG